MSAFDISIHALLAESDEPAEHHANSQQEFLSTLSLRRATQWMCRNTKFLIFLSTLSLRRATASDISVKREARISIHALLAESDLLSWASTAFRRISIHALLAESDDAAGQLLLRNPHFYPRSPCGERLFLICKELDRRGISIHALLAESDLLII